LQTRLTLSILCHTLMASLVCAAPEQASNSVAEIQAVLTTQQDAWNHGDIDAFMNGYAKRFINPFGWTMAFSIIVSTRVFTSGGSRVIWREPAMKTFV